ncbi:MAG: nucleotidyltransferase family protein [Acidobacteriaceae bacterium]
MISALVLAAGRSMRMGSPKMLLPWGSSTVIEKVISTLEEAGLSSSYVITGGDSTAVRKAISNHKLRFVHNPNYASGEMLSSVQVGLESLPEGTEAALIVLGDQPQVEAAVIRLIVERYRIEKKHIIVPSYRMHRGHPWLADRTTWQEIINLKATDTLRDYLIQNQDKISYISVDTPSILQDLDTPHDYQLQKP